MQPKMCILFHIIGSESGLDDVTKETLTASQLTKDAADLVVWLCERFHKDIGSTVWFRRSTTSPRSSLSRL